MALDNDLDTLKYDSRLYEFQLRHGQLTKAEIEKHLNNLPDSASNVSKVQLFDESKTNGHAPADPQNPNLN
jgi:hypothetical protein